MALPLSSTRQAAADAAGGASPARDFFSVGGRFDRLVRPAAYAKRWDRYKWFVRRRINELDEVDFDRIDPLFSRWLFPLVQKIVVRRQLAIIQAVGLGLGLVLVGCVVPLIVTRHSIFASVALNLLTAAGLTGVFYRLVKRRLTALERPALDQLDLALTDACRADSSGGRSILILRRVDPWIVETAEQLVANRPPET